MEPFYTNEMKDASSYISLLEVDTFDNAPHFSSIARQTLYARLVSMKGFIADKGEASVWAMGFDPSEDLPSHLLNFSLAGRDGVLHILVKIENRLASKIYSELGSCTDPFTFDRGHTSNLLTIKIGCDKAGGITFTLISEYEKCIYVPVKIPLIIGDSNAEYNARRKEFALVTFRNEIGVAKSMKEMYGMGRFIRNLILSYN